MASVVQSLYKKRIITKLPKFVPANTQYEVIMGSVAYGVSNDTSDMDIYGFCIPPRDYVFPHLRGEIPGFSEPGPQFDQYQEHHILDKDAESGKGREYDLSIYSIIKFFRLCMENNPNMIDSLFVPRRCILYTTPVGELVRENRKAFLHKGAWHKFKGYAYSQVHKMNTKNPVGKRKKTIQEYGYDVKFAYHVVRLLNEVEQILTEGDLDLERNREQLKAIRRGDWSQEKVREYFEQKENELESVYTKSELPHTPDIETLQSLLLECLETHYGSLEGCVVDQDEMVIAMRDIDKILEKIRNRL
ncbi:MAG: nucleotidyltransferase domain-containing protein [Gammaproteobacteria bacterium]|nr:nucleotidyltransferase domain-containing protein [Gammaproteobacteria bacterium]MDH5803311.1 nucleotidyltransferase domain-containing protein [Gammaproteobacteria bacterium]